MVETKMYLLLQHIQVCVCNNQHKGWIGSSAICNLDTMQFMMNCNSIVQSPRPKRRYIMHFSRREEKKKKRGPLARMGATSQHARASVCTTTTTSAQIEFIFQCKQHTMLSIKYNILRDIQTVIFHTNKVPSWIFQWLYIYYRIYFVMWKQNKLRKTI